MKFYEFNTKDYEYYALIGAETVEQAKEFYNETVADIEYPADDNVMPDEISEAKARELYEAEIKEEKEQGLNCVNFNERIKQCPCLLLIDGCLL